MKYLMTLLLIPSLLAGPWDQYPKSVRKLLEKPWAGPALLTFQDGTSEEGQILRVTNQYLAFRKGPPFMAVVRYPCEQVEPGRLADVKMLGPYEEGQIIATIILAPFWIPRFVASLARPKPLEGLWESAMLPGGLVSVVEFSGTRVTTEDATVTEGTYRFDGRRLHLSPDSGVDRAVEVAITCGDEIVVDSPKLHFWEHGDRGPAHAPIVGYWATALLPPRTSWDLRPDGTFRIEMIEAPTRRLSRRHHNRIKLDSGEEWTFRRKGDRLFLTRADVTTEYRPRAYR